MLYVRLKMVSLMLVYLLSQLTLDAKFSTSFFPRENTHFLIGNQLNNDRNFSKRLLFSFSSEGLYPNLYDPLLRQKLARAMPML